MENVHTVVRQEARDSKANAIKAIGDTINGAQQGMDLAFAAGTLSTSAGVDLEDSSRYAERHNVEDTKKPAVEAKTYLKRALEKSSELSKDNYKQVKEWLEKDEDTLILTMDFLSKARNEMKRTLKLTLEKIKNPGSLGANPKRDRSST